MEPNFSSLKESIFANNSLDSEISNGRSERKNELLTEESQDPSESQKPIRINPWVAKLSPYGKDVFDKLENVFETKKISKHKKACYRFRTIFKNIFLAGPLRIFSKLHNSILINLENRGSHPSGALNYKQVANIRKIIKKELAYDPDNVKMRQLNSEMKEMESSEKAFLKPKSQCGREHFKKLTNLQPNEWLWLDLSSQQGRHSMKGMIERKADGSFSFYFINTGIGVEEYPELHSKHIKNGKEKYQVVVRWDNLSTEELSQKFLIKLLNARFSPVSKKAPTGNNLENFEGVKKIYDILQLLPPPTLVPYSKKNAAYWKRLQAGFSCVASSLWRMLDVRNSKEYKIIKLDSRLTSLEENVRKIFSGKEKRHNYKGYVTELIHKIDKSIVKVSSVPSIFEEITKEINIDESFKILPNKKNAFDYRALPIETNIEIKQVFFDTRHTEHRFIAKSSLHSIEGSPTISCAFDDNHEPINPSFDTLAYLLYYYIAQGETEKASSFLEKIAELVNISTLPELKLLTTQSTLKLLIQLFMDMALKIHSFDSSRLGIVKSNTFFALGIVMTRILDLYEDKNVEFLEEMKGHIRKNFPELKQASLNLSSVDYVNSKWRDPFLSIMRSMVHYDSEEIIQQQKAFDLLKSQTSLELDLTNFYGNKIDLKISKVDDNDYTIQVKDEEGVIILELNQLEKKYFTFEKELPDYFFFLLWQTKREHPPSEDWKLLPICTLLKDLYNSKRIK